MMTDQLTNYSCVDLAFAYKVSKEKKLPAGIDNFINECVLENKEQVIQSIKRLHRQYSLDFIIQTFSNEILAGMFAEKSQKQLLDIIRSGSIVKVYNMLLDSFLNDEDIKLALDKKN
ncbi:hypothetical protein FB550_102447 [Neobacillus bataviensis]|uniref:Uncharacterized protein n=1 Tax=Neobacillus bataviensis TaxID=220685 RepID=A0A561DSS9_9BACI|nr:hypothetical protein [Neobacillus bataviensis]TWE06425.1 hypothetical protein FB550_102447 [Neobacillus bataviensis]